MNDKSKLPAKLKVPSVVEIGSRHLSLISRGLNAVIKIDSNTYYLNGLNAFSDKFYTDAAVWFEKGAQLNHAPSQRALGCMYEKGLGVRQSSQEAFFWFKKAADQGYAGGEYSLGFMYVKGRYVEQSREQALYWYTKAANQGYAEAQYYIGFAIVNGYYWDLTLEEGILWLKRAAEQGDQWAQWILSYCYMDGEGVEQSYEQALYLLKKSAVDIPINPEDQLAFLRQEELSFSSSIADDVTDYEEKFTGKGCVFAQEDLGNMYKDGICVEQSYENAAYWYQKSADQGWEYAQYKIGYLYENGFGVERNLELAIDFYKKSSAQGYAPSNIRLKALGIPSQLVITHS
jgi:TPR repeat protein